MGSPSTALDAAGPGTLLARAKTPAMDVSELVAAAERLRAAGEPHRVAELYATWLAFHDGHPLVHAVLFNAAIARSEAGDTAGAILALSEAIRRNADFLAPYINLGNYLEVSGRDDLAVAAWRSLTDRVSIVTPDAVDMKITALKQIARVLERSGDDAAAEAALLEVILLDKQQPEAVEHWLALRQRQCEWPALEPLPPARRRGVLGAISPLSLACHVDDPLFQLANAWRYNRQSIGIPTAYRTTAHHAARFDTPPEKLRIGYVSSDFRDHAVGFSLCETIELHDRSKVEVYGYYCGSIRASDTTQRRLRASFDHWTDISSRSDEAAASIIEADGIHILVDLNGYTKDARTALFARRPAPINVNWFGYPGSMGSPYHHYIVADDAVIPAGFERFYSERVLRLPCYQPNDRKRVVAAKPPTRQDVGLPADAVVYCCLNGLQKLNAETFARWMTVLTVVPGSVLWLLAGPAETNARLRAMAEAMSVSGDRLVFAEKAPNPVHVARYALADVFLDNLPYGAHTTAADSLWMGVPVVTLPGLSFASRVCASLVRAAGTAETIASSPEDYVRIAVQLATDPARRQALRQRLLDNRGTSLLFDSPQLVTALEGLYTEMWSDFAAGRLPVPDLRNLDLYHELALDIEAAGGDSLSAEQRQNSYTDRLRARDSLTPVPNDARLWT